MEESAQTHHKSHFDKAKVVLSFVQKHAMILTLLFVLGLQFVPNEGSYPWGGIWMRSLSGDLLVADSAASSSVDNYITQQVSVIANQRYPNLPDENKQKVVADLKEKFASENSVQLESEKKRLAGEIRAHYSYEVDGRSFLYMPDIDPYYYLRFARNVVEKGHYYDKLNGDIPWDDHTLAPVGSTTDTIWHPQFLALLYSVYSSFDSGVTLMEAANYFPMVVIFLSLICAFFVARKVAGNVGGFFAVTVLALLPAIMGRTPWGHADTDAYTVFFPLLAVWMLFEALSYDSSKKQLLFGGLCGLAVGLFAKFWGGWWYLFDFIGAALFVALVGEFYFGRKLFSQGFKHFIVHSGVGKIVRVGLSVFFVALIFCSLTIGFDNFVNAAFFAALGHTAIKDAALSTLWPNVFTTVAELNPGSFNQVLASVGGKLMFAVALLGVLVLLFRKDEHGKYNLAYSALIAIWFVGTIYMTLKGIRFILLIGPAFSVAFGVGIWFLYDRLSDFAQRVLHIKSYITKCLVLLIAFLIIANPSASGASMVRSAYGGVVNDVPIVNDAWWNGLTKIKENSQPDAIINSWWDFGHHFKFISDRSVTFDGGTQNSPQAHWIGRVLQTDNEAEAVAILRMLDCGANTAFDVALNATNDAYKSVSFVKSIIMQDKADAVVSARSAGIPESVVELTHCDAPEDFFIASADMVGKAGVWSHFGLWNFERAEIWNKWRHLPKDDAVKAMSERFNWSVSQAEEIYNDASSITSEESANAWISPWSNYITSGAQTCSVSNNMMSCGIISLNLSSQTGSVRISQGTASIGKVVIYNKDGSKKVHTAEGNADVGVVVWPSGSGYYAIAAYSNLVDSMFSRLYFMEGFGLKHFDYFDSQSQLIGGAIRIYKVDWQGGSVFVPESLAPKTSIVSGAKVAINYIGWSDDGVFDSSIPDWKSLGVSSESSFDEFKSSPLQFVFGQGSLIPGFEKQIVGLKKGDVKTIVIPPQEAYGTDPSKHPLGNKTLTFKLRIEAVE